MAASGRGEAGSARTASPGALCADVNRLIADNLDLGQFITFFHAVIDVASRCCTYTIAGHNPPILVRNDTTVERLTHGGPPLGLSPEWNHGVTELRNSNGEEFGDERLIESRRFWHERPGAGQPRQNRQTTPARTGRSAATLSSSP